MADPKDKSISKEAKAERAKTVDTGDFSPIETTGPKRSIPEMRDAAVKAAMPPEEGPPTPPAEPAGGAETRGTVEVPVSVLPDAKEGDVIGAWAVDRIEGDWIILDKKGDLTPPVPDTATPDPATPI